MNATNNLNPSASSVSVVAGLQRLFYLVPPSESMFKEVHEVPDYVIEATPTFLMLIVVEFVVLWLQGKPLPRLDDSITSITAGIISKFSALFMKGIEFVTYLWIYENYRLVELPWDSVWTWIFAGIAYDFGYYWVHRFAHEINFMWAAHQVHHSSEDYNLTTALRQSVLQQYSSWIFYLPIGFFVPPSVFLVHAQFNLLYQFWIHTETIGWLGPLEYIINTPSAHRVHHGRNRYCIDNNYAGVLIIWDILFGTYAAERTDDISEKVVYGLVHPIESRNAIYVQLCHWQWLITCISTMREGLIDKLKTLLYGPGWEPGKPRMGDINDIPNIQYPQPKYQTHAPTWLSVYALFHFLIISMFNQLTQESRTAFNINVNGVYHCSLRFKQLHNFYEQLRKEFGSVLVPPFPPKKLFSLAPEELEERRIYLEKWIQAVSQDTKIQNSHIFTSFFLNAQKETVSEPGTETNLDVFLMNGHKITVQIMSTDQTDTVHEAVCSSIQLNDEYVYYFGIFLVKKEGSGENSIVRRLQEFESPCLSLRAANKKGVHRLVLRKSYWDATWDDELLDDRVAMNLLYVQALSDIERGWVQAEREQLERLAALQQKNSKKEYLRLARTLKYYNYVRFKASTLDYPAPDTPVIVYAGNKQLNFIISKGPNKGKEGVFLVTRMRCWRITSLSADIKKEASSSGINSNKLPTASSSPEQNTCMELAVEYLVAKNDLKWITMQTEQAILISMCLQGMVDELMMKKAGRRIRRPQDREKNTTSSLFMKRDGTFDGEVDQTDSVGQMALDSVKRLSEKITSINLMGKPKSQRTSHQSSEREEPKNSAFGGIGDDDL